VKTVSNKLKLTALIGLFLTLIVALSGCQLGKSNSTTTPPPGNAQTMQLSAEQTEAVNACLNPDQQKAFKPSQSPEETNANLLAVCKTTGKDVFGTIPDTSKGDVKVGTSPANIAATLDKTNDLNTATFQVKLLKVAKSITESGLPSDRMALADQLRALLPNANQQDVRVGTSGSNPVALADNQNKVGGSNDFHDTDQFKSTQEIAAFFASGTPKANAAKESVTKAIKDAGLSDAEVTRAMNGSGYIPIQMKDASQILGTSYFKDGKALVLGQWRQSLPGDIYWLFVSTDGKLVPGATLRGKCANPNAQAIRIVKPGIPPAPSVTQPPGQETCVPNTVLTPTGECLPPTTPPPGCKTNCTPPSLEQKDPSQDPAQKGNAGNGAGKNTDSGPGAYVPPNQMAQPPAAPRVNPAPPAQPTAAPPPKVVPTKPATTPTVVPSAQPPNHGSVDPNPGPGQPCNPDFQNC
jgi:hypothetical protein